MNGALLSRCQIYELRELSRTTSRASFAARCPSPSGGSPIPPRWTTASSSSWLDRSGGDARAALGALERAVETARAGGGAIDLATAEDALQRKAIAYDRQGDKHYDYISAFIKAMRGSDPDASVYYLAVMLEGGEDPRFIARRMVIFASEDVGNADPQALAVATAAGAAVDRVGLPECALNLSQAAAYLALAPKSNASTVAIGAAARHVRENGAKLPPGRASRRPLPGREATRARTGLRVPALGPGRDLAGVAASRRGARRPLLRAHRPGLRGKVTRAPRRATKPPRRRLKGSDPGSDPLEGGEGSTGA